MFKISFEKNPRKPRKKKGKREFSKIWLTVCVTVSVIFTAGSYVLSVFDKQPLEGLSTAIIETLWGTSGVSFIGYALQNSARAFTSAKFGIPEKRKEEEQ